METTIGVFFDAIQLSISKQLSKDLQSAIDHKKIDEIAKALMDLIKILRDFVKTGQIQDRNEQVQKKKKKRTVIFKQKNAIQENQINNLNLKLLIFLIDDQFFYFNKKN